MSRRDQRTLDLLSWEAPDFAAAYPETVAGRGPIDNKIARLVSQALRDAKDERDLGRTAIAEVMSAYLGRTISSGMLDKWASEASDEHRIPLDAFAALIHATGVDALLGFLPGLFKYVAVPERYAHLIELYEIEEHEKEVAARKAALQSKMRAGR
ncbi:hypothetical protein [Methylopila sp. M107]|uniref:hypothetical protein n=1 Tax=Methylopila sp. M107 TaxID=1101190 RepID=UPI000360B4AA|nr:hypothetical protein [Methylopila sp. M107]